MSLRALLRISAPLVLLLAAQLVGPSMTHRGERPNMPLESALMGSQAVVVDYFWFDLLQYFGGYRLGEHDLSEFIPRYERLIRLDEDFHRATIFASVVRATDMDDAAGAIEWLRRAEQTHPDLWFYPYEQGFIHYLWLENYQAAESDFRRAGEKEGVHPGWRHFVARIQEVGGDPILAYEMWLEIARNAEHPDTRAMAEKNLRRLEALLNSKAKRTPGS